MDRDSAKILNDIGLDREYQVTENSIAMIAAMQTESGESTNTRSEIFRKSMACHTMDTTRLGTITQAPNMYSIM
jgi:hypothetical protein